MIAAALKCHVMIGGDTRFKKINRVVAGFPEAAFAKIGGIPTVPAVPVAETQVRFIRTKTIVK